MNLVEKLLAVDKKEFDNHCRYNQYAYDGIERAGY